MGVSAKYIPWIGKHLDSLSNLFESSMLHFFSIAEIS